MLELGHRPYANLTRGPYVACSDFVGLPEMQQEGMGFLLAADLRNLYVTVETLKWSVLGWPGVEAIPPLRVSDWRLSVGRSNGAGVTHHSGGKYLALL